jgi:hypothetical protein
MQSHSFFSCFGVFLSVVARFTLLFRFEDKPVEPLLCGIVYIWRYAHIGGALRRWMEARMDFTMGALTATSASWNVTVRAWRTILAPILISFVCKLVNDQSAIGSGKPMA